MFCSTNRIIKYSNEITYIIPNVLSLWCRPVKHIQQFKIEAEAVATYYDIILMEISVILTKVMNFFDPHRKRLK